MGSERGVDDIAGADGQFRAALAQARAAPTPRLPIFLWDRAVGSAAATDLNIAEGFMNDHQHIFDIALHAGVQSINQDGEVDESHNSLSIDQALGYATPGDMALDAALVTLDFALRRQRAPSDHAEVLTSACARLNLP